MRPTLVRAAVAPFAALCLTACLGALLGGGKPAQMYRFGTTAAAAAPGALPPAARTLQLAPVEFADEIDTDRLLASRGSQNLYIKEARWVSPAPELFAAALHGAFRRRAPDVALVDRRDGAVLSRVLQVRITRFEASYASVDKDAVPEIRIEGEAVLTDARADTAGTRYRLAATQPAASGRIEDIVAAFDAADARVVDALADWAAGRQ